MFPGRCPMAPDAPGFEVELRHFVVGEYRALFTVEGRIVFVLHVRHGKRQPATRTDLARALRELRSEPPDADQ